MQIEFVNTYAELGEEFCQSIHPSTTKSPGLILFNHELAEFLGIDPSSTSDKELSAIFSGNKILDKSHPLAMAYAGHQFGSFVPQLGDGRAVLLGEVIAGDTKRYDIQLKGAGQTRFSRNGDGRSALGPVIREYVVSEAMHALGIPSSRALAAVATGEKVYREQELPGGILTRVASSHLRVGTFEYFYHRQDYHNLKILTDYSIDRHYPELLEKEQKYFKFFQAVARRKIKLVAKWMSIGFIHGVMNTDNTSISGETIDFGPCAFMDTYVQDKAFSSIDHYGRYAYHNQGTIALWNLSSLANCLAPLLNLKSEEIQQKFDDEFNKLAVFFSESLREMMGKKLGIFEPLPDDSDLISQFLKHLEENHLDFTNSFRKLPENLDSEQQIYQKIKKRLNDQPESIEQAVALMNSANPYIIPRNHLVERAISLAHKGDYGFFKLMVEAYKHPYQENLKYQNFTRPPQPHEEVRQTFCGT